MLQSVTGCYRVLQSITEHYRILHRITEYCRVLQSITEYYKVSQSITKANLAHLLGPFFGLVLTRLHKSPADKATLAKNIPKGSNIKSNHGWWDKSIMSRSPTLLHSDYITTTRIEACTTESAKDR